MEIRDKAEHDPVTDIYNTDAYMRWALMAAEEVIGEKGLAVVLRDAGLERFIDNYPPEEVEKPTGKPSISATKTASAYPWQLRSIHVT